MGRFFATIRRRSAGKKSAAAKPSASFSWKSLVCGIRPLHLHHLDDALPPSPDSFHDVIPPPPSPARSSSADGMSRYTSAEDLKLLDEGTSEIDAKAEEFIARFYEQIRLQRLDSIMGRAAA